MAHVPFISVVDGLDMGYRAASILGKIFGDKSKKTPGEEPHPRTTSFSDEALVLQLDNAIIQLYQQEGPQYIYALRLVRQNLEPKELERWRKVLLAMEVPEVTETPVASHKITRKRFPQQVLNQRRRGGTPQPQDTEEDEWKYGDPVKKSAAFTVNDPRIQHLVHVAKLVLGEADVAEGIVVAMNYLEYAIFVEDKVLEDLFKKALAGGKVILSSVEHAWLRALLGSEVYDEIGRRYPNPPDQESK